MIPPHAVVVKAPGTNCDVETADALMRAGASASVHTTHEWLEDPELILGARIVVFPGGFAHGDDVASARILASLLRARLGPVLRRFVDQEGGHVLGICNGFQALVKAGLLPRERGQDLAQRVTVVHNDSGRYACRWVRLRVEASRCAWLPRGEVWDMPVGHGEGKFVPGADFDTKSELVAFRYVDANGDDAQTAPANPNGSIDAVAGICDESGRVLGLMPHPDRSYLGYHHPLALIAPRDDDETSGSKLFRALVNAASR
ncbi:MAG TPA: phosphoribosylformylglycinamidine synthase subunit PurQ [Planctomycetota bacterium]|nr:phosphoribosylformylglycinamidine synthase subunit PurQ [Planctomycetota bacterium]